MTLGGREARKENAMLSDTMTKAVNEQIKWELYSGYLYLSMSAWFADKGMPGFTHWMRLQAQEELMHAMKFYDFLIERGGSVELHAVDAPPKSWASPLAVIQETLKHEQSVTARINELMNLAMNERDHATTIFLQWYVTEQVEEEDNVGDVLAKLKLVGDKGEGLFMLDKELGQRVLGASAQAMGA